MARANRHFIPGQIWHLTHRCHKREFLLKFARGRKICKTIDGWELREAEVPYNDRFDGQNGLIEPKNLYFWRVNDTITAA